jgi:hypothetical protein
VKLRYRILLSAAGVSFAAAAALEYIGTRRARGKVVVTLQ